MENISSSYQSYNGETIPVGFTKDVITLDGGKEVIVCTHEKYEMRLLKVDNDGNPDKDSKIIYNAQITSRLSGIIIHAPVIKVTGGSHSGAVMIGRTAHYKKHRALLSRYVARSEGGEDRVYDSVTIPYSDYMVVETMLREVCTAS